MVVFYNIIALIVFPIPVFVGFISRIVASGFVFGFNYMQKREANKILQEAQDTIDKAELAILREKSRVGEYNGILDNSGESPDMDSES